MQIYKITLIILLLLFHTFVSAQNSSSIQGPVAPTVTAPSVVAPTPPSLQSSTLPRNATVETRTNTTSSSSELPPTELSSEMTTAALEALSGLFAGDVQSFGEDTLGGLGDFSSIGELSALLESEVSTQEDATTIALLQEILLKLSELEAKIDELETKEQETSNE